MILKTVAYKCRWSFSESFLEAKIFVWKFSVIERKHRITGENVFSGLSKAQFTCPMQYFEKMMINVNLQIVARLGLCVFFYSDRKVSQVCQKHKPNVKRNNLLKIFLSQMFFSKNFQILSTETWSFSKKVPAWLSQLHSMGQEEHFGITFWSKFLNISTFLEY